MGTMTDFAANEPKDGAILLLRSGSEWTAIKRADALAQDYEDDKHWFDVTAPTIGESDPATLAAWIEDADAVYALGEKLAEF